MEGLERSGVALTQKLVAPPCNFHITSKASSKKPARWQRRYWLWLLV